MLKTEEKELLMEDLNARIGTDTKVRVIDDGCVMVCKLTKDILPFMEDWEIRPYLRPMESMTEDEYKKYRAMLVTLPNEENCINTPKSKRWLDKNHFDYRGLIEKGLALEAPEDMYKKC